MRLLWIIFLFSFQSIQAQEVYREYCDSTFSFCVKYPTHLLKNFRLIMPGNFELSSDVSQVKIRVWASKAKETIEPSMGFKSLYIGAAYSRNITYEVVKKDWFVISGFTESEDVFYHKLLMKNDIIYNILLEYPVSEKKIWDKQCGIICNSLKIK
jgi:hypothetical protein